MWILILVFTGSVEMMAFGTRNACIDAGRRTEYSFERVTPTEEDGPKIEWHCVPGGG